MPNAVVTYKDSTLVDINITPNVYTAIRKWLSDNEPHEEDANVHSHVLAELCSAELVMFGGSVPSHYAVKLLTTESVYLLRAIKQAVTDWRDAIKRSPRASKLASHSNPELQRLRSLIRYAEQLQQLLEKAAQS